MTDNPFGDPPGGRAPLRATPIRQTPMKHKMTAKPNWEDMDPAAQEMGVDRLHVPRDEIPEGMDLMWVTNTIFGQPSNRRPTFERTGWTPVHQADFDGQFDGRWLPKGKTGEIELDGLVLMARPIELSLKARAQQRNAASEALRIKQRQLTGGEMPGVTLDSQHPSAVNANKIRRSVEPVTIPED